MIKRTKRTRACRMTLNCRLFYYNKFNHISLNAEIRKFIEDPLSNENSLRHGDKSLLSEFPNLKDNIWENNKKNNDDSIKFEKKIDLLNEKKQKFSKKDKSKKQPTNQINIYNYFDSIINEDDESSIPVSEEKINVVKNSEVNSFNNVNGSKLKMNTSNSLQKVNINNIINNNLNKISNNGNNTNIYNDKVCLTTQDEIYYDNNDNNNYQYKQLQNHNSENHNRYYNHQYSKSNIRPLNIMTSFGNFTLDDKYVNTASTNFITNEDESFADYGHDEDNMNNAYRPSINNKNNKNFNNNQGN